MIKVEIENDGIECTSDCTDTFGHCEGHYKICIRTGNQKIYQVDWLNLKNEKLCLYDSKIKRIPEMINNYNYIMKILFSGKSARFCPDVQKIIMSYHLADISYKPLNSEDSVGIKQEQWESIAILYILNHLQVFPKVLNNIIYQYSREFIELFTCFARNYNILRVMSGMPRIQYNI